MPQPPLPAYNEPPQLLKPPTDPSPTRAASRYLQSHNNNPSRHHQSHNSTTHFKSVQPQPHHNHNRPSDLLTKYRPLKGILKKSSPAITNLFKPTQHLQSKRFKPRGVTFCLNPLVNNYGDDENSVSTTTSSWDPEDKTEDKTVEFQRPATRRSRKSEGRRIKKKKKGHKEETLEDPMASKTAPGPLSLGLYICLWLVTIILAGLFAGSEWRSVQTRTELLPLKSDYLPVSCQAIDENNGRVVHIDCPLRRLHTFYPSSEFSWNLKPFSGLFFEMKVEMYQWILKPKSLGFSFGGEWSPNLVDSSTYPFIFYNAHINPDFFPHINGAGRKFAPVVYGGSYRLSKKHLFDFHERRQLQLDDDGYYTAPSEQPPTSVTYANTQVFENALYTGNPLKSRIGDLRISFWGSSATHVSALAQQRRNPADGEFELVDYHDGSDSGLNNNTAAHELVYEGDYTPQQMFTKYIEHREGSTWVLWFVRLGSHFLLTALVAFSYRIFDKSARVAILPLIIGSALVAAGILLFSVAPLWLLCDLWRPVLFWIGSPITIVLGVSVWALGKQMTSNFDDIELELVPKRDGFMGDNTKHYYQPV